MTMAEYLWLPCWDALVKQIDSYDRGQEGRIRINFTLYVLDISCIPLFLLMFLSQDGTKRNELSEVCRERFPHKVNHCRCYYLTLLMFYLQLIVFYESLLQ
jgi:hypothetical protein